MSRGDPNGATAVITSLRERRASDLPAVRRSAVASQLGEALRARGLVVVERVGQSGFRVDLAVRRPEDDEHRVAVLIDGADRIASQPVPERVLGHPGVLRATGWRVVHVLTRDWLERSEAVIEAVERAIATDGDRDAAAATEVRDELERATAALATKGVEAAAPIVDPGVTLLPLAGPTAAVVAGAGLAGVAGSTGPAAAGDPGARLPVLRGRSVCFTGSSVCSIDGVRLSRDDQERLALAAGMDVRQSVTSRLDYLVVSHEDSQSTKAQRAAQLGVRRIAEPEFWQLLGVVVDRSVRSARPTPLARPSAVPPPPLRAVDRPGEGILWAIEVPGHGHQRVFAGGGADVVHVADGWGVMFPHLAFRSFALADGRQTGSVKTGTPIRTITHLPDGDLLAASDSRIHRLSPVTLLEGGRWETRIPKYAETMVVRDEHVALATWQGPNIGFLGLADGKVRRRAAGDHPRLLEVDDAAFVMSAATGTVWTVDPAAARITPAFTAFRAVAVAATLGILWLIEGRPDKPKPSKRLLRFDLATGADVGGAELPVALDRLSTGRLGVFGVSDEHVMWIAGPDGQRAGRVWRAEPGEQWIAVDADRGLAFTLRPARSGGDRDKGQLTCHGLGV